MNTSTSIQIYTGIGSSELCSQAWKREISDLMDPCYHVINEFHAGYDAGLNRGNVSLVLIPGGNGFSMIPPMMELAGKIMETVNKRKASYLGSCAGTLVCSPDAIDLRNMAIDFTSLSKFNLNPLQIKVPYYLPGSAILTDPTNKSAIEVEWLPSYGNYQSRIFSLYHAIGPAFSMKAIPLKERFNVCPLVTYKTEGSISLEQEPAAAILYRPAEYGASPRLFTGVHPEISVKDFTSNLFRNQFNESNCFHVEKLTSQLEGSEQIRREMVRSWLSELGIKLRS